jgi:hypothetical protein
MHFAKTLLLAANPLVQRFHLNVNNIPARSTCRAVQKHQEGQRLRQESHFPYYFSEGNSHIF